MKNLYPKGSIITRKGENEEKMYCIVSAKIFVY